MNFYWPLFGWAHLQPTICNAILIRKIIFTQSFHSQTNHKHPLTNVCLFSANHFTRHWCLGIVHSYIQIFPHINHIQIFSRLLHQLIRIKKMFECFLWRLSALLMDKGERMPCFDLRQKQNRKHTMRTLLFPIGL